MASRERISLGANASFQYGSNRKSYPTSARAILVLFLALVSPSAASLTNAPSPLPTKNRVPLPRILPSHNSPLGTHAARQTPTAVSIMRTSSVVSATSLATSASSRAMGPATHAVQATASTATQGRMKSPGQAPLGGIPTPRVDFPVMVMFLVLFILGAITHISIHLSNAKRGHKFLLSDLLFDFCMVRVVTCILRIIWTFIRAPGVALAANLFQNGGAGFLFAVNLFFAQRIVRAMQPSIGWHPLFGHFSLLLVCSIPAITIMDIITGCIRFFSAGKPGRLQVTEDVLIFGASWNMMLAVTPLLWVFFSNAKPGPPPENFGIGSLRAKATLLVFSAGTLAVGAAVRLRALSHPEGLGTTSPVFSKETFYTTGFMLELFTVGLYAIFRVDLTYHVPNGAKGPGDYAGGRSLSRSWTTHDIEKEISNMGVRYDILSSRSGSGRGPLLAMLYPTSARQSTMLGEKDLHGVPLGCDDGVLSPRYPSRVSRRLYPMDTFRPDRPPRAMRTTMFMTSELPPEGRLSERRIDFS